ncbi:hypothetical protein JRO89_XS01G0046900 [Xanthoceras sorbifolium]|uniref:Tf2-1-like SH3-like domain-containing protein n=1 Tax=Xanthoceras sorbifolium TaxID=99658 RepID=A0ABQ8II98_9ROSI|nr:hypothetical protein JRO89_XS01G0046900 [Xanthoceras sorbifolium]
MPAELPKKLPPRREVDHQIELEPGTKPPAKAPLLFQRKKDGSMRLIAEDDIVIKDVLSLPDHSKPYEVYRSREGDDCARLFLRDVVNFHPQTDGKVHKGLVRKYEGPFPILKKVGKVSYKVELPPRLKIHPVFYEILADRVVRKRGVPRICETNRGVPQGDYDEDVTGLDVDQLLQSVFKESNVYTVVVVNGGGGGEEGIRVVVGKYRHAWIVGRVEEEETGLVSRVAEVFVKVFANGGREEGLIHGEFMPVGADGRIVLSFNLLNAEPNDWLYDWDFQRIDETVLAPIIEVLEPIANISVESQVLYHTPKSSFSYWDENQNSYIFNTKDLPFFANSNEWHLDTSTAAGGQSKILQFVVYIPTAKECPLRLQLPNGEISKTNGFISPMWGGVIVLNPRSCLKDLESKQPQRHTMSPEDLQEVFEVFMGQFRQIFGLKSDNSYVGESGTFHLLPSERGFTEWELDVLSRQHTCFNLHSCATTLGSLSRLVQSLPRMIIMDEIGKQVKFSIEAAKLAQSNASKGVYESAAAVLPASFDACSPSSFKRVETIQARKGQVLGAW